MKYLLSALLVFAMSSAFAQNGYEIKVTLKPFKNQYIYLGHYYGKQLPIVDSVKLNDKSEAVFRGPKKLGGGIYLIGYPDRAHNFEFLIDKNQRFSIVADTNRIESVAFVNSPENLTFKAYQKYMAVNGRSLDSLYKLRSTPGVADSIALSKQIEAQNARIRKYRTDLMTREPGSLMSALLRAMREPEVPQNDPAAKRDSMFAYHYFKKHYWDGVSFFDDRLARTPFFESRIDKYYEQLVYPDADSVIHELDYMLGYATASEEMQKFLLLKFINRYLNQKYMWEDKVFVHLFQQYFADRNYSWLNDKGRKLISDRAYSLMANIMGTPASDIELPDSTGKQTKLYDVKGDYVLVAIWDPTCGHCKEVIPQIDSAYQAQWKSEGVKLFGLAKETEGKRTDWTRFINDHHLKDWTHVYYSKEDDNARISAGVPSYSQLYDVQSFPTLYLLDKDKKILAKKVTVEQVNEILAHRPKAKTQ